MDLENKNSQLETQLNQCQNKLNEIQSLNTCYNARIDILNYRSTEFFNNSKHRIIELEKQMKNKITECDELLRNLLNLEKINGNLKQSNESLNTLLKQETYKIENLMKRLEYVLEKNSMLKNQLDRTQLFQAKSKYKTSKKYEKLFLF